MFVMLRNAVRWCKEVAEWQFTPDGLIGCPIAIWILSSTLCCPVERSDVFMLIAEIFLHALSMRLWLKHDYFLSFCWIWVQTTQTPWLCLGHVQNIGIPTIRTREWVRKTCIVRSASTSFKSTNETRRVVQNIKNSRRKRMMFFNLVCSDPSIIFRECAKASLFSESIITESSIHRGFKAVLAFQFFGVRT